MPTRSWNSAHFRSRNQMVKNNKLIFLEWQAVKKIGRKTSMTISSSKLGLRNGVCLFLASH